MMGRFALIVLLISASYLLPAQSFPCAQKQPKLKEQKGNQRKFTKWSHRRHVKRGTVYLQPDSTIMLNERICLVADKRSLVQLA
jgi:hypothetical protein